MGSVTGVLLMIGLVVFGFSQLYAGYLGIEYELSTAWAIAAVAAMALFRLTFFITVGSFFGAWHVWGWHWALAALFAVPGLALLVPGAVRNSLLLFSKLLGKLFGKGINKHMNG